MWYNCLIAHTGIEEHHIVFIFWKANVITNYLLINTKLVVKLQSWCYTTNYLLINTKLVAIVDSEIAR